MTCLTGLALFALGALFFAITNIMIDWIMRWRRRKKREEVGPWISKMCKRHFDEHGRLRDEKAKEINGEIEKARKASEGKGRTDLWEEKR